MKALMLGVAEMELADAVAYYEARERGLGARFLDEVVNAIAQIELMPKSWPDVSRCSKRCRLRRFPYGLIYQLVDERAIILAAAHLKRKPLYWLAGSADNTWRVTPL